jgi:hypothetical protein
LYASPDAFEAVLANDPHLTPDNYVRGSVFRFVLEEDLDSPVGQLNVQGALADWLARNSIEHTPTSRYKDFYDLVLTAQPDWLYADIDWVNRELIPSAGGRTGPALWDWLAEEFRKRFRYVDKPPEWIQSPIWPIGPNGPLVFLGQLDVNNYFHDAAAVYIVHDPSTGQCESIIQCF